MCHQFLSVISSEFWKFSWESYLKFLFRHRRRNMPEKRSCKRRRIGEEATNISPFSCKAVGRELREKRVDCKQVILRLSNKPAQ